MILRAYTLFSREDLMSDTSGVAYKEPLDGPGSPKRVRDS